MELILILESKLNNLSAAYLAYFSIFVLLQTFNKATEKAKMRQFLNIKELRNNRKCQVLIDEIF